MKYSLFVILICLQTTSASEEYKLSLSPKSAFKFYHQNSETRSDICEQHSEDQTSDHATVVEVAISESREESSYNEIYDRTWGSLSPEITCFDLFIPYWFRNLLSKFSCHFKRD